MKYARVFNNEVVGVVDLDGDIASRTVNGELVLRPLTYAALPTYNATLQALQERYIVEPTQVVVEYDIVPLFNDVNACKTAMSSIINIWREEELLRDVVAHGRYWQTGSRNKAQLSDAITLAIAGAPLPLVWRDAANDNMVVDNLATLVAIASAMAEAAQAAYVRSWQLKDYVQSLPDTEDTITTLSNLTWDTLLPE